MVTRVVKSAASSSAVSSPSESDIDESSSVSSDSPSGASEYSSDSESHSGPSVHRARATRVSRRRWRNAHSKSTSALMPPAEPASTSLWTTREKQFEKFRSSMLTMPVPDGVTRIEKAKGYSLHVMSVLNWVLTDSILHTSAIPAAINVETNEDEEEEPLITLGVHVSLFHSSSKRFFGNTWVSPELAIDPFQIKQARHPKDGTLRYIIENALLNFRAYFITDVIDANCVGVLELVAYEKDPDSKATVRVVGCGWTLLPLFARQQPMQVNAKGDTSSLPSGFSTYMSGDSVSIFTGSPRALWELSPTSWNAQEKHEGCKFYYQVVQYEPLLSISMFLRKNELVGALDTIPGLKNGNLANIDIGKNPKLLLREEADTTYEETLASFVKIASLVPKSVQVDDPFELNVIATRVAINLREEIEANLVARLKISRKAVHEGATSVDGEVSARVLKISLHNGRRFRTRQFTVPLKADPNGGDTLLCVRNSSKLRGFVFHPNMAIIVVLQYTVHFRIIWPSKLKQQALEAKKSPLPEEDVILVTMGARALVPSDGKKLYLYDKHHNATTLSSEPLTTLGGVILQAQEELRRVLHIDLLSGPPCRPYSDNTLYTPPDQVARSLQSRGTAAKDSFAFCDLKITIDGDLPADEPTDEAKTPASPVKSTTEDNNQTSEENCAAEQWAKKLLGKANSNPVLAQTLNALATSPVEDTDKFTSESKPSSPSKKQSAHRSVDPAASVPDAPTSELSRASKTLLTRYGYMESHDKQPVSPTNNQKTHHKRKAPKKIELIAKSINTEVNDDLKANEVRFHFAAYRACSPNPEMKAGMPCEPAPARVYFTFQFYNFPPTRTETLRLSKAFDNGASGDIQTFLLMREGPANKPSLAIQFDVDTTATQNPLETRRFAEYLKWNNLYVDVWDADSLFQLGTFAIPLHELLRQGSGVKKFQAEIELAPPLGGALPVGHSADDEGNTVSVVPDKSGAESTGIGRVQLLMSNYGLKGEHFIAQPASTIPDVKVPAGAQGPLNQLLGKTKHRVRARPLVESNEELYRLLSQEGFYGDRRVLTRKNLKTRQTQNLRSAGDVNTLSPKEIGILCELFGSRKNAGDASQPAKTRSTRIKCDLDGKTGLLALLSLRPPEIEAPNSQFTPKPGTESSVVVADDIKKNEHQTETVASDHAERLKRVMALATKNQVALADAFALFDVNKDGFLSPQEFVKAMRSLGTVFADLSDDDLRLLADLLDRNKDGKIEYQEFKNFIAKDEQSARMTMSQWRDHIKRIVLREMDKGIRVHHVFAELDASGDGKLSLEEFEQGLFKLGISPDSDKQGVQELLAELDKDRDGTISYTEFLESLGISVKVNKNEVVKETVKDITEDVRKILKRLVTKGITFEEVFLHFDTDRNGTLSVEEFTQALNQLLQLDAKSGDNSTDTLKEFEKDAVEVFVKSINADGDSKIDYREFLNVCGVSDTDIQKEAAHFQQGARDKAERKLIKLIVRACAGGLSIQDVFEQFDANSDGNISLIEFQTAMEKLFLGQGLTAEDAAFVAARFDTNKDKMISRQEFQKFGCELQMQQQTLAALFIPHLNTISTLDQSSKLPGKKWTAFCRDKLGLSSQIITSEVLSLLSYFGFIDDDGSVDVQELVSLCNTVQSAKPLRRKSKRESAVEQLQTLLAKAKEQGVDLKKSFAHFDANGDGEITRDELKRGLLALGCFKNMTDNDFDALIEQLDEDGSGNIDFREFRALVSESKDTNGEVKDDIDIKDEVVNKLKTLLEKAVEKGVSIDDCFGHFDKDGDGNIKREEFMTAMTELGLEADQSVINGVIKLLDCNGSGTISLSEFKHLFPAASVSSFKIPTATSTKAEDPAVDPKTAGPSREAGKHKSPRDELAEKQNTSKLSSARQTVKEKLRMLLLSAEASGVDVKQCFVHFDSDKNGIITKAEFIGAMKQLPGFETVSDDDILSIVKELDKDESGSVSLEEFEALLRTESTTSENKTREDEAITSDVVDCENSTPNNEVLEMTTAAAHSKEVTDSATDEPALTEDGDQMLPPTTDSNEDKNEETKGTDILQPDEGDTPQPPTTESTSNEVVKEDEEEKSKPVDPPVAEEGDISIPLTTESASSDGVQNGDEEAVDPPLTGKDDTSLPSTERLPDSEDADEERELNMFEPPSTEEGDMSLPPTANLPDSDVVKEADVVKTKDADLLTSEARESTDETVVSNPAPSSPEEPTKQVESTTSAGEENSKESLIASDGASNSKPAASGNTKLTRKPPVRSSSFGKGKEPETGALFRRTKTDSEAVSAEATGEAETSEKCKAPSERVSFAAVRAAKKAEMAATTSAKTSGDNMAGKTNPLEEAVSDGLSKLRKLLLTAANRGVAIQDSFNHFDKAGKGALSYDDFVKGLRELGADFANLSDDEIAAMTKSLDSKQVGEIRVEDFVSFTENDAATECSVKTTKSTDPTQPPTTNLTDTTVKPAAATKRPPPLRRSGSSRIPAKKPPRPSSGIQSARTAAEASESVPIRVQDKHLKPSAGEEPEVDGGPSPNSTQLVAKYAGGTVVAPPQDETVAAQQTQEGIAAKLDCTYTFHSDPAIRAVELKLRRTALDAYHRGILPLRVIAKFLEGEEDRRARVLGGTSRERPRKKKSELLRVEFLQVLMELGFTLLSDQSNQDEDDSSGGLPRTVPRMNDHLYARQLERLSRYRQHIKGEDTRAHKQLMRAVAKTKHRQQICRQEVAMGEDSLRRFQDEKTQLLRVLSYYRDGQKKSLVYSLLREQVTTSLALFPSFGELLFFELPFVNPYNNNDRFRIELLLPSSREIAVVLDVEIVRSSVEWAFYRENLPLAYGFVSKSTEVENEMIDDHNEVVMDAHDQLHIPMRLRWLDTNENLTRAQIASAEIKKKSAVPVSVVIKSCSHGHTVALFNMELQPQPFICNRVLRFSHPASSIWRWKLRYPRGKFIVCMDPSVAMVLVRNGQDEANNSGLASFRCRIGEYPALEMFYVVLYDDKYYACVYEVWQIRIQSKLRVDVHAVLGQSVRHDLVIKGDDGGSSRQAASGSSKRHVKCFTPMQHQNIIQFRPSQVFSLVPQAFNRIEFSFCAVENSVGKQMVLLVNLVDVETHELVGAWSVHVTLALPVISKTYELRLPVARAAQKKISYANPWDQPQTIVLRSSAPRLLVPKEPVLQLPSNGQAFLRLAFTARPRSAAISEDIYLFINDKRTDQSEECLLFQVTYE